MKRYTEGQLAHESAATIPPLDSVDAHALGCVPAPPCISASSDAPWYLPLLSQWVKIPNVLRIRNSSWRHGAIFLLLHVQTVLNPLNLLDSSSLLNRIPEIERSYHQNHE